MARVRNVKAVVLTAQSNDGFSAEHGKTAPANFGFNIHTQERSRLAAVQEHIRVIDVARGLDKAKTGQAGSLRQACVERIEVLWFDGEVHVRIALSENIVVVPLHTVRNSF